MTINLLLLHSRQFNFILLENVEVTLPKFLGFACTPISYTIVWHSLPGLLQFLVDAFLVLFFGVELHLVHPVIVLFDLLIASVAKLLLFKPPLLCT